MALQFTDSLDSPSASTARVYIPTDVVTDSAFPFAPGDTIVCRTIRHDALVLTRPECTIETIDLPPINDNLL